MDISSLIESATTESDFRKIVFRWRWADGFDCPRCHNSKGYFIAKRSTYECSKCKLQSSATSRTSLHGTRNVKAWIEGIDSIASGSNLPATRFSKEQNLSYGAAWLILHKVRFLIERLVCSSTEIESLSCSSLRSAIFKSSSEPESEYPSGDEEEPGLHAFAERFVAFLLVVFHGVSRKYVQLYLSEFSFSQDCASVRLEKLMRCLVRGSPISDDTIRFYRSPNTVRCHGG